LRLDEGLHVSFFGVDLPFVAAKLKMHGPGRSGNRDAERLAHHVGKARDIVDRSVELGHGLEGRHVVHFLVDPAELGLGIAPTGEGDHR